MERKAAAFRPGCGGQVRRGVSLESQLSSPTFEILVRDLDDNSYASSLRSKPQLSLGEEIRNSRMAPGQNHVLPVTTSSVPVMGSPETIVVRTDDQAAACCTKGCCKIGYYISFTALTAVFVVLIFLGVFLHTGFFVYAGAIAIIVGIIWGTYCCVYGCCCGPPKEVIYVENTHGLNVQMGTPVGNFPVAGAGHSGYTQGVQPNAFHVQHVHHQGAYRNQAQAPSGYPPAGMSAGHPAQGYPVPQGGYAPAGSTGPYPPPQPQYPPNAPYIPQKPSYGQPSSGK